MTSSTPSTISGRLVGRRIIVTGAASGIGKATAQLFAQDGASVALLDRDVNGLTAVSRSLNCPSFVVDVADEASVAEAVEQAAAALGGIDGLVNTAGIMRTGLMDQMPTSAWHQVLAVNLTGTYLMCRACLPWIRQAENAAIINVASAAGLLPNAPGLTAYAASKGGVINLTRALAAELAPAIRVNTVCPGMVDTPMADGHRANVGNYALKRLATPLEIAQTIRFLISAESAYVTGAALVVDGGRAYH